jgi:hypothetical protein
MTILIEGSHTVKPLTTAAFNDYVDFYGNEIVPAMERHGFDLLGAWKCSGGPLGRDIVLTRFSSVAEYERASASLAGDPKIGRALETLFKSVQLVETTKLARPLPYATEQRLERALAERPEAPRQYGQAILGLTLDGQARALEVLGEMTDFAEAEGMLQLATAYETLVGPRPQLTDLWILPGGAPLLEFSREDPFARFVEPLRECAPEEEIYWLNPLPYSPLQ